MPDISVVMPTNRLDHWLSAAVASVLASEHADFELVVVQDGVEFAEAPAWASDPRVVLLPLAENVGQTAAMNAGIRASHGRYIARLDSDDLVEPERLSCQQAYLEAHPSTVAVGATVIRIDEDSAVTGIVRLPHGDDVRRELLLSNVVSHSSLMFRRSAFDVLGGYDERLRQMEDYEFILRLGLLGPIANLPDPLIRYRVHSTQTSRGAGPSGPHISAVARGRVALGRAIGASRITTQAKLVAWRGLQYLRYSGAVRPGHER